MTHTQSQTSAEPASSHADSETLWSVVRSYHPGRVPLIAVTLLLATLWFLPIVFSSISDADGYFAHVSAVPHIDHVSMSAAYAKVSEAYYRLHPGWAPLGPVPLWLWLVDAPVLVVKLVQFALVLCAFIIYGMIAQSLFRSDSAAAMAVVATLCAWQFRTPHDPVAGTSLLTPWAAVFVFLPVLFWLRYRESHSVGSLSALYITCTIALLTTQLALPLIACLTIAMFLARSWYAALGSAFCIVAYAVADARLSSSVALPWQHGGSYAANVFAQLFAAIPTSFRSLGYLPLGHVPSLYHNGVRYIDDRFINVPAPDIVAWLAIAAVAAAAFTAAKDLGNSALFSRREPLLVGLALCLVPALFLGSPMMWRHGLPLGQAFDNVFFEYFGFGLLIALATVDVARRRPVVVRLLPALAGLTAFFLAYGNVRSDAVALARYHKIDAFRAILQRAGSAGFFDTLPSGSSVALDPRLPFARGITGQLSDARYAIYHYTKRIYRIENINALTLPHARNTWVLRATPKLGVSITLSRFAGRREHHLLTDRALGYTFVAQVADSVVPNQRGVNMTVLPLRDGSLINAHRVCGPVPVDNVFAQQRPTITWGPGFFNMGPAGYSTPPPALTTLGDIAVYPKKVLAAKATLWLNPTTCTPAYVNMRAVAVGTTNSVLNIKSSKNHIDQVAISTRPAVFWVRFNTHSRKPIPVQFWTDAPDADIDPVLFRYDKDVPRHGRLIFEVEDRWEDTGNPYR